MPCVVQEAGHGRVGPEGQRSNIGAGADDEEDDCQQRGEIKERRLRGAGRKRTRG
jgi:hypothetical protein